MTNNVERKYDGRMLRVDLTSGTLSKENLGERDVRLLIGGSGFGARILCDEIKGQISALEPANKLVFAVGPLTGTGTPGSGTYSVTTKGPLTNLAVSAHANGSFGAGLKFCGLDGIVLEGASPKWVYLRIDGNSISLVDASHLLGRNTWETEDIIRAELGDPGAKVACIGPAGENMVWFAAVVSGKQHVASTGGVGAVMGSKKLKAIAVTGGSRPFVHDNAALKEVIQTWAGKAKVSGAGHDAYGTLGAFSPMHGMGGLPVKNLTTSSFPEHARFGGNVIRADFPHKRTPCPGCPLRHCQMLEVVSGPYKGLEADEPEYEAMAAWSSNVGITDPGTAIMLSHVSDTLGIDIKEATWTISLIMECMERGLIGPADIDGVDLRWGNDKALLVMLNKIATREGIGNVLAQGVMRTAQHLGGEAPNFAVYTKHGIAPHVHDPRSMWSMLFGQAISDIGTYQGGGLELRSDPNLGYLAPIPNFSVERVPKVTIDTANTSMFWDTLLSCRFVSRVEPDNMAGALRAVTGWDFTVGDGVAVGERAINLFRLFNIGQGHTPSGDSVSPRLGEIAADGPLSSGLAMADHIGKMVEDYYEMRGWDKATGIPLPGTLRRLGLS